MRAWLRRAGAGAVRRPFVPITLAVLAALAIVGGRAGWLGLWATPDQQGRWLMERQRYAEAAEAFRSPIWRGVALMQAGQFKDAAAQFGGLDTAEAAYDQGNALVMLGKYEDAVGRYDRALALRPDWDEAVDNRRIAQIRAERLKTQGGDETGGQIKPDEIVIEPGRKSGDAATEEQTGGPPMSDQDIRALWLKRVQTRPGDFLRAKFAYQLQRSQAPGGPP
jgi:Ca-activated chloride channel family protein